jgi:hypothetical protein
VHAEERYLEVTSTPLDAEAMTEMRRKSDVTSGALMGPGNHGRERGEICIGWICEVRNCE